MSGFLKHLKSWHDEIYEVDMERAHNIIPCLPDPQRLRHLLPHDSQIMRHKEGSLIYVTKLKRTQRQELQMRIRRGFAAVQRVGRIHQLARGNAHGQAREHWKNAEQNSVNIDPADLQSGSRSRRGQQAQLCNLGHHRRERGEV